MKVKIFWWLLFGSFFVINSIKSQQLGWTFDEVVRLKGKDYKIGQLKEGTYTLNYEVKTSLVNGQEYPVGYGEVYRINANTSKVLRYTFVGLKRESDIVEIIEKNNSKFKKVDMGSKQNFYQWIDIQNNAEYTLSIQTQLEDNKFILYDCAIKE